MIRVVGIVAKYQEPKAAEMVRWLITWLKKRKRKVLVEDGLVRGSAHSCTKKQLAAQAENLIISLGGDGTLLDIRPSGGAPRCADPRREYGRPGIHYGSCGG